MARRMPRLVAGNRSWQWDFLSAIDLWEGSHFLLLPGPVRGFSTIPIGFWVILMPFSLSDHPDLDVRAQAAVFETASLADVLVWTWEKFGVRAAIGTSFQGSGLVIIDQAVKLGLGFPVFTLDTGLLFPETYELKSRLERHFGIVIEAMHPEQTVDEQAGTYGPELWRSNPDTCCAMRKVLPLQKKLAGLDVWITGVRRNQSDGRATTQMLELYEFDKLRARHLLKLNPMAAWSREAIWDHIKREGIPYNALHDRGYHSIGCWPCTKLAGSGEGERAGRWEGFDKTECGIHTFMGANI